jgi:hypothetical protein
MTNIKQLVFSDFRGLPALTMNKHDHPRLNKVTSILASLGIALVSVACVGCLKPTPAKIAGGYTRKDGPLVENIVLHTNGTFDQTVHYSGGENYQVNDKWSNDGHQVQFMRLYITRDIESSKVLSPPELRQRVNFMWEKGVLAKNPDQGYVLRLK